MTSIIKCGKCLKPFPAFIPPYDYEKDKGKQTQLSKCPNCNTQNKVKRKVIIPQATDSYKRKRRTLKEKYPDGIWDSVSWIFIWFGGFFVLGIGIYVMVRIVALLFQL